MTTFSTVETPPIRTIGPSVVRIDPSLYLNHSAETIIPELNNQLTTVGISDEEVLNRFTRILLTGELHSSAQSLLDSVLGLAVNISYDPLMHESSDTKIRFRVNKPFMSEPVELGKSAPCARSTVIEKGCKRQTHFAGLKIELAAIQKIFWILSKDESELRSKLSGLEDALVKFERLRVQSTQSLSQSFKRGTVRNVLQFIKQIAPDVNIVHCVREMTSNVSIKEITPVSLIAIMLYLFYTVYCIYRIVCNVFDFIVFATYMFCFVLFGATLLFFLYCRLI